MSDGDPVEGYYGRPILKEPAWTVEVPWYLFVGGLAGASSVVAVVAEAIGDRKLARASARIAALGGVAGPILLIKDLGRPARFLNMLRMFKVTSPLSVGSWVLAAYSPAAIGRALVREPSVAGFVDRHVPGVESSMLERTSAAASATLGPVLSTYTAVLFTNTAIPAWHGARREMPWVFATSSVASAGAAAILLGGDGPAARRLSIAGAVGELVTTKAMERRLGELADAYEVGEARPWSRLAKGAMVIGLAAIGSSRSRPMLARLGAVAVLTGALSQRFAVFKAGFESARATAVMPDLGQT